MPGSTGPCDFFDVSELFFDLDALDFGAVYLL